MAKSRCISGRWIASSEFSFLLYLRWSAPAEPAAYADGVASADNDVQQVLDTFARLLESVGAPLLDGDPETYARMKAVRWWDSTPDVLTGP